MIIWLNGAFGAGKTQTAYELQRRLPGSYVYDPENAGFFIRRNLPSALNKPDFQDYPTWRTINYDMLDYICGTYAGDIIVPMTITNREYYDQIVGALAKKYALTHLILSASREVLLQRLASRFESKHSWGAQQIERCLQAFDRDITAHKIDTDHLTIPQVAEQVAAVASLTLAENRHGHIRQTLDRIVVQCKHIR